MTKTKTAWQVAVADSVTLLADTFGRKINEVTFRAYEMGLDGVPVERLKVAVRLALQTCKFMPSPSELRELSAADRPEARALKAWMAVREAVRRHGYIRTVSFDDPVVNAVIRFLGGWERLCDTPAEHFDVHTRRDFEASYVKLVRSGVNGEACAPLVGWIDRQNAVLGYGPGEVHVVATGLPPLPGAARPAALPAPDLPRLTLQKP